MSTVETRVAQWLVRYRTPLAVLAVLVTIVSVAESRRLEFVRSIDTMFDRTDPALVPYRRMLRAFGSSEVVLAAYDDPELFSAAGIERLRDLTDTIAALPGVASATSLADRPLGNRIIEIDTNPTARRLVELLEGYAVGTDHRTAAVVCVLQAPTPASQDKATKTPPRPQADFRADAIDRLRTVMSKLPAGTVAG